MPRGEAQPLFFFTIHKGVEMPSLSDMIVSVTSFLTTYGVFIAAGVVLGLAASMFVKMLRSGR